MPDYKAEQDWLMRDLEQKQRDIDRMDLEEVIAGIDRMLRRNIVELVRNQTSDPVKRTDADCFARWEKAYRTQRPGAIKLLEKARQMITDDLGDL